MLTNEDIQNLIKAQEEVFVTKLDLENFRDEYKKDFDLLQKSVDAYAVKADKFFQELVMLAHKVDRHEKWLHQIAEKLGIKLEY
jgi:hypothetical protein